MAFMTGRSPPLSVRLRRRRRRLLRMLLILSVAYTEGSLVGRRTCDRKVVGSTPGRVAIKWLVGYFNH